MFFLFSPIIQGAVVENQTEIDAWKHRDVTCRNYIMATSEPTQEQTL